MIMFRYDNRYIAVGIRTFRHADKGELKLQNLLFSIETVAPIFLVVLLGMVLRRWRVINEAFLDMASIIVFRISLPAMVFIKIAGADFQQAFDPLLIGFGIGGTLLFFWVT
jgi:malonate transporter